MRLVTWRGTAAVRATRLLLDRHGRCCRILHAFKNNTENLLRRRYSSHLCDLLCRKAHLRFSCCQAAPAPRPTLAAWCRRAYTSLDRPPSRHRPGHWLGGCSARPGCPPPGSRLPNGSRRWCRQRGGGDVWSCTKRSSMLCSVRLLLVNLGRSALVGGCEDCEGVPRRCRSRFLRRGRCLSGLPAAFLGASSWAWHFFLFSDGRLWFVDPTVVTTMEPGLSRILVSEWRGRS